MKQVTSAFPLLGHAWRPVSATENQRRRLRGHRPPTTSTTRRSGTSARVTASWHLLLSN